MYELIFGLTLPLIGTVAGSAMIFLLRDHIAYSLQKILLGFAAGVMIAASVWSLLIPCIEMSQKGGGTGWLPAALGFFSGVGFLLILDNVIPHLHLNSNVPEGTHQNEKHKKTTMLTLAVTLHNIPEGMAVGVVLAGSLYGTDVHLGMSAALVLSIGIAIQNFPEGAVVSMPLRAVGASRLRAFLLGSLSGAVEPIAAIITILLISLVEPILPFLLAFAAGAMIYVVVEELIPESQDAPHSNWPTISLAIGFVLMMVLDIALA